MTNSSNHHQQNSIPRYGVNPSSNRSDSSSSRSSSTRTGGSSSSASGNAHDDTCHFAFSPELQLVDSLVSILAAQNAGRASNGGQGQR